MIDYKVIDSFEDLPKFDINQPVFADIETENLYVGCRLIQLYQPQVSDIVYIIDTDILDLEEAKAIIKPLWTVWQGCSYDFGTLNMTTDRFDDTLYLARTAYPEWREFTLDNIVERLGYGYLYEGLDKKVLQKAGFIKGSYLSHDQLRYAITDVYALSKVWESTRIQAVREKSSYKVDILNVKYAIEYQQNNLIVNQKAVREELDKLVDIIAENEDKLGGLNPNSPKQVKEYLGTNSSSKEVLIDIITKGGPTAEMAQLVYDQRRLLKRRTFLNSYNYPYVTTRFNPAGAATGRFTSTGGDLERGINAQQITRDLQYIFNTDTDDTVVVHADYSTAELRAGCSIMRDEAMYNELKAGKDLHIVAASMASGIPESQIDKKLRQKGKAVSFGKIFGQSWKSFIEFAYVNYGVVFTPEESKAIHDKYNSKYTGISSYHKEKWNNYKTIPVQTPLGRRNMAMLGTDAINFATQGCIAETTKLAVHYMCKAYPEATKYIYNIVHDAIYLRVPKGLENLWAKRLVEYMKKGWEEMCKCDMLYYKDIPMPVEVEYNDYSSGKAEYICKEY